MCFLICSILFLLITAEGSFAASFSCPFRVTDSQWGNYYFSASPFTLGGNVKQAALIHIAYCAFIIISYREKKDGPMYLFKKGKAYCYASELQCKARGISFIQHASYNSFEVCWNITMSPCIPVMHLIGWKDEIWTACFSIDAVYVNYISICYWVNT